MKSIIYNKKQEENQCSLYSRTQTGGESVQSVLYNKNRRRISAVYTLQQKQEENQYNLYSTTQTGGESVQSILYNTNRRRFSTVYTL